MTNKSRLAYVLAQPKTVVRWDGSEDAMAVLKDAMPDSWGWIGGADGAVHLGDLNVPGLSIEFGDLVLIWDNGMDTVPAHQAGMWFEQLGPLSRGGAQFIQLPDSPAWFEEGSAEWLEFEIQEHAGTKWERQETRKQFWAADSYMRDGIKRLAGQLRRLHDGTQFGDSIGVGNGVQKVIEGMSEMASLQAQVQSMRHRYHAERRASAAHAPEGEPTDG